MIVHTTRQSLNDALPKTGSKVGVMFFSNDPNGLHAGHHAVIKEIVDNNDIAVLSMGNPIKDMPKTLPPGLVKKYITLSKTLPIMGATKDCFHDNLEVRQEAKEAGVDHLLLCPIYKDEYNAGINLIINTPEYMRWIEDHGLNTWPRILNMFNNLLHYQKLFTGVEEVIYYLSAKDIFFRRINESMSTIMRSTGHVTAPKRDRVLVPVSRDRDGLLYEAHNVPQLRDARIALRDVIHNYNGNTTAALLNEIKEIVDPLLPPEYVAVPWVQVYDLENIRIIEDGTIPIQRKCQLWFCIAHETTGERVEEIRLYNLDETKRINSELLEEIN